MTTTAHHTREELTNKLVKLLREKVPGKQADLIVEFTRQYLAYVSVDDLAARDIMDLYGSVLSHWNFIYQRKPGEVKVRVFNPSFEQNGWQSTHTIVEVAHDDMPFIVDSLQMEINRAGYTIHFIIHVGGMKFVRDKEGIITKILPLHAPVGNSTPGAPIYIEIDRQTDPEALEELQGNLIRVLSDVRVAVEDWKEMRAKVRDSLHELEKLTLEVEPAELAESKDFLRWLENDHFTFLGCRDYQVKGSGEQRELRIIPGTGLGVLRDERASHSSRLFSEMPEEARKLALSPEHLLIIAKTNTVSTVHRPVHTDYVGVKLFDKNGKVWGERRFIGLYTSAAYNSNPKHIPFLRRKVALVMKKSTLPSNGHAAKALLNILETLPRDDLFQANSEELLELGMGIFQMQERQRIRLFMRKDVYGRFLSCLVFVPRERFNTELRQGIQGVLGEEFNSKDISFVTRFTDSVLARIYFVVRIDPKKKLEYDIKEIEAKLVEVARTWQDELKEDLIDYNGEERGISLYNEYCNAFAAGYRESFLPRTAVYDIEHIERLTELMPLGMSLSKPMDEIDGILRLRLYRRHQTMPLSDVIPILENMGLRVIGERPYEFMFKDKSTAWINDFSLLYAAELEMEIETMRSDFQEAFSNTWFGKVENDGFNRLILGAGLNWREVSILRAYAKYFRQIGFTFSQTYIEETLWTYPMIARDLVKLFHLRFDPTSYQNNAVEITALEAKIHKALEAVTSLDDDRIINRYLDLIHATLRTNYFQVDEHGELAEYLAFKLDPSKIPEIPLPRPLYEIFVYSPRFEGVHLRGGKVARGGLRWSDRREDFRTEVLGLMKAQQVKNALIVPLGAKGGFVPKALPQEGDRDAVMEEVIYCYQNFIRGLLCLTDNQKGSEIIPPANTVRYDDDDTYLVVAADKGTATFSDIANDIAMEYGFWLGDAFASGGRTGYDHKKMGITARGAWESVKRHFRQLGINTQTMPFTVIGVGDMAGDVFGNGMLLSRQIKLVAAFNHQHIFIDPTPDPEISYKERERLFNLPRSAWTDYDEKLLSKGAGIFYRSAKSIKLTPEIRKLLDLKQDFIVPNDLIGAILKARVDLFWNGGIGTFFKGETESHTDVGDRANDAIRINGSDLRCRAVGEGGNLGFTQLARVEFEMNGGLINTDFIDNSAGVDCSDHEVNIKILLNEIVSKQDLTEKQRNELLAEMSDDVAHLVLRHNYNQSRAITSLVEQSKSNIIVLNRYIEAQARLGKLDRELEFLPDEKGFSERKSADKGLTRPEIAVLLAYSKNITKQQILNSSIPEDQFLARSVEFVFPKVLREKFPVQIKRHPLRREIIATQISNYMTDDMGITFVDQLHDESGAPVSAIVRAYAAAQIVFNLTRLWRDIEALDYKVEMSVQTQMMIQVNHLIRRATRWFLRNRRRCINVEDTINDFKPGVEQLYQMLPELLTGSDKDAHDQAIKEYVDQGVPADIASEIASTRIMFIALDIVDAAQKHELPLAEFAKYYSALGDKLEFSWVNKQIAVHTADDYWTAIARAALRDDIDWQRRCLTVSVLTFKTRYKDMEKRINAWLEEHKLLVDRWSSVLAEIRASTIDLTMLSVAVRVLMDMSQTGFHAVWSAESN